MPYKPYWLTPFDIALCLESRLANIRPGTYQSNTTLCPDPSACAHRDLRAVHEHQPFNCQANLCPVWSSAITKRDCLFESHSYASHRGKLAQGSEKASTVPPSLNLDSPGPGKFIGARLNLQHRGAPGQGGERGGAGLAIRADWCCLPPLLAAPERGWRNPN